VRRCGFKRALQILVTLYRPHQQLKQCLNTTANPPHATVLATALLRSGYRHGFVGKGDVQSAFEWNNEGLQVNAEGISFTFSASTTYNVPPRTGAVYHAFKRFTSIDAGVVAHVDHNDPQDKITGFNLTGGYARDNTDLSCPGIWEANGVPTLISGSNGASLLVHHGHEARQLFFIAD
jgi:hypothetical protein